MMVELLSAHQPVYLPWLGLFHKIAVADLFIVYDDVPYSRYLWYNRNQILGANGPLRISVPIRRNRPTDATHAEVIIDNSVNWRKKHWRSIVQSYRKAPFFDEYAPDLSKIYEAEWHRLVDLDVAQLKLLLEWLDIQTPVRHASTFEFRGAKSDRALDMASHLKATALLFGSLGADYADRDAFAAARIAPLFQQYDHPTYDQTGHASFTANMSAVDLIFNHGPNSREILLTGNPTRADYLREAAEILASTPGGTNEEVDV